MTAALSTSPAIDAYLQARELWAPDPVRYFRERLGKQPTWQQRQFLEALAPEGAHVSVRSGHDTGKTTALAGGILWFLETRDYPRIPITAPTSHQLRDVLWAEIAKLVRGADDLHEARGDPDFLKLAVLFAIGTDRIACRDAPKEWYAVARTARPENPDALQGFHGSDLTISEDGTEVVEEGQGGGLFYVVEEASGVPDSVFEVAEGALASRGNRLAMVGNPTRLRGYFADSHRKNRAEYTALHFRTQDSPLADPGYRDKLARKFGEDSNVVRVRADGEFPRQDDDSLISLELTEAALHRPAPAVADTAPLRMGIDVARRGSDRTVFVLRQGPAARFVRVRGQTLGTEVVGNALEIAWEHQVEEIFIDVVGLGAGPADSLRERLEDQRERWEAHMGLVPAVIEVNAADAPPEPDPGMPAPRKMRDYLWLAGREWLRGDDASFAGMDVEVAEDLAGELATPTFRLDESGRVVVESKEKLRQRGVQSPDLADAFLHTFAPVPLGGAPVQIW